MSNPLRVPLLDLHAQHAQLRDEIAHGTTRDPVKRVRRSKGQMRRRTPTTGASSR